MSTIEDAYNTDRLLNGYANPAYVYNGRMTNVNIDNALAAILNKFDTEYILDAIRYSLEHKFRPYDQSMPNIVYGYEQEFIELLKGFSTNQDDIIAKRTRTYVDIIKTLCEVYELEFNDSDNTDYYSAAFYLYNFLVSEFTNNIITFYVNFIIHEKDSIYNLMGMKDYKKNDISLDYSHRLFKSDKLSMIHTNISAVMANMETIDIDLHTILDFIYGPQSDVSRYIYTIVADKNNLFKNHFSVLVSDPLYGPELQTLVKLNLQSLAGEIVDI